MVCFKGIKRYIKGKFQVQYRYNHSRYSCDMKWYTEVKGVLKVYSKYEMVFETNKRQNIKNGILMRKPKPKPKKSKPKKQNIDKLEKALLWAPPQGPKSVFLVLVENLP